MIDIRRMRWTGHLAHMGLKRNTYTFPIVKPAEGRTLGRTKHRWKDNIQMDIREIGCGGVDWSNPAQDRNQYVALVNAVINFGFHNTYV
jgi:hypothetical protein